MQSCPYGLFGAHAGKAETKVIQPELEETLVYGIRVRDDFAKEVCVRVWQVGLATSVVFDFAQINRLEKTFVFNGFFNALRVAAMFSSVIYELLSQKHQDA